MNIEDAVPNKRLFEIQVRPAREQWRGEFHYRVFAPDDVLVPVAEGYAHTQPDALEAARDAARRYANHEPYEENYEPARA